MAQTGVSQNVSDDILGWLFRGGAYTPPGTLYLAAATATPDLTGDGTIVEPNTPTEWIGYARVAVVSSGASWAAAAGGAIVTAADFAFPTSGGGASSPVAITNFALMDDPTTGRIVAMQIAPANLYVASGDTVHLLAGALFTLLS